jgi:hypothetical protein
MTACTLVWLEGCHLRRDVKASLRFMEEQAPAVRAHQPRDRKMCPIDFEVVSNLTVLHRVGCATSIQRVCTGSQSIDRSVAAKKSNLRRTLLKPQLLQNRAPVCPDRDSQRVCMDFDDPSAPMNCLSWGTDKSPNGCIWPHFRDETTVSIKLVQRFTRRSNGHPQDVVTHSRELKFERSRSGTNSLADFRGQGPRDWEMQMEEQTARTCADTLHERTSRIDGTQVSPSISKDSQRCFVLETCTRVDASFRGTEDTSNL